MRWNLKEARVAKSRSDEQKSHISRKGEYNPKAVIQQAIAQQLSKIYEPIFSESSYGFRQNRSCHDAILKAKEIMNNGYKWVVDLDLEKFFDTVNQDLLISIIRKYLQAGVLVNGVIEKTEKGTPKVNREI